MSTDIIKNGMLVNAFEQKKIVIRYINEGFGSLLDKKTLKVVGFNGENYADTLMNLYTICGINRGGRFSSINIINYLMSKNIPLYDFEVLASGQEYLNKMDYCPEKEEIMKRKTEIMTVIIPMLKNNINIAKEFMKCIQNNKISTKLEKLIEEAIDKMDFKECEVESTTISKTKRMNAKNTFYVKNAVNDEFMKEMLQLCKTNINTDPFFNLNVAKINNLRHILAQICGSVYNMPQLMLQNNNNYVITLGEMLLDLECSSREKCCRSIKDYLGDVINLGEPVITPKYVVVGNLDKTLSVSIKGKDGEDVNITIDSELYDKFSDLKNFSYNKDGNLYSNSKSVWQVLFGVTKSKDADYLNMTRKNVL